MGGKEGNGRFQRLTPARLQGGRLDMIEGEMKAYKKKLTSVLGEFHGLQARQSQLK